MGAYEWTPVRARLRSLTFNANYQPTFTWSSSGGARYRIQSSNTKPDGPFMDIVRSAAEVTDPGSAGVSSVMTYSDTNSAGLQPRFYRLQTISQP